jgi:hypothetical protein
MCWEWPSAFRPPRLVSLHRRRDPRRGAVPRTKTTNAAAASNTRPTRDDVSCEHHDHAHEIIDRTLANLPGQLVNQNELWTRGVLWSGANASSTLCRSATVALYGGLEPHPIVGIVPRRVDRHIRCASRHPQKGVRGRRGPLGRVPCRWVPGGARRDADLARPRPSAGDVRCACSVRGSGPRIASLGADPALLGRARQSRGRRGP